MSASDPTSFKKTRPLDFLISVVVLLLIWQAVVWLTGVPKFILPGPVLVFKALVDNAALIFDHSLVTIAEVLVGLVLGTGFGMLTALWLTLSSTARRFLMPVLIISQIVPVFALAPMLTLWLGYGIASKIAMTLLIIYFPVTSSFYDGLKSTPRGYLDLAQTMGASRLKTLLKIQFPAALSSLASGLRLAAVYAPIGAVIGEWVGASNGLGYLMLLANGRVKIDLMFAALIALCVFTILLRSLIGVLSDKADQWAAGR
ncbi:MAG: ABC transporter permease [Granulosicoccus sp.]|nr:ABC transporter permease [Granulosicoccus sp.]